MSRWPLIRDTILIVLCIGIFLALNLLSHLWSTRQITEVQGTLGLIGIFSTLFTLLGYYYITTPRSNV